MSGHAQGDSACAHCPDFAELQAAVKQMLPPVQSDASHAMMNKVCDRLDEGILVVDANGLARYWNVAVRRIIAGADDPVDADRVGRWYEGSGLRRVAAALVDNPTECSMVMVPRESTGQRLQVVSSSLTHAGQQLVVHQVNQADQARHHEQSERDKRLKAMGEMAIAIAHEVRNPLGSIELLASILRRDLAERPRMCGIADRIVSEVKSLDHTLSNLLSFTRSQEPRLEELNITSLLAEFVRFITPVLGKNDVTITYAPLGELYVRGDSDLLKQVFLNLALNALQAIERDGRIQIHITSYCDQFTGAWYAEICFIDNGCGITPEALSRIFNPFYTTRANGTGLGLSIVHNIIAGHEGVIDIQSEPNKGTKVVISLPLLQTGCRDDEELPAAVGRVAGL